MTRYLFPRNGGPAQAVDSYDRYDARCDPSMKKAGIVSYIGIAGLLKCRTKAHFIPKDQRFWSL
jgi:hypothetical protein